MDIVMQILYLRWIEKMLPLFVTSVIFSVMNLYLFFKSIPSDLKSPSSVWFDMRSICHLLCNNMHSYRSGKWHRKCKQ